MANKMNFWDILATTLLVIGGLNWGLAVFNFNLVTFITLNISWLAKTVYSLVGISAVYAVIRFIYLGIKKLI